jgi:hypothetical protein
MASQPYSDHEYHRLTVATLDSYLVCHAYRSTEIMLNAIKLYPGDKFRSKVDVYAPLRGSTVVIGHFRIEDETVTLQPEDPNGIGISIRFDRETLTLNGDDGNWRAIVAQLWNRQRSLTLAAWEM